MIGVNKALDKIAEGTSPLYKFKLSLNKSGGYFLANDVVSPMHMPPFRQSSMDGFAVNSHNAKSYKLIREIKAGDSSLITLKPGDAVRIYTGAAVPDTANAIVIQENAIVKNSEVIIDDFACLGSNIRPMGEQIKKGAIALKKGSKLTPAAIGFLASLGVQEVVVYKKPTMAIVTTGNELVPLGKPLHHGQVYESNAIMLAAALEQLNFSDYTIHSVKDNYEDTHNCLHDVISKNNVVLVTGGISVGKYDFVGKALQALGVEEVFYKVNQKPGKPLFFGKKDSTTIFALPGNPAAALSCFYVYVNQALQILSGNAGFRVPFFKKKSKSSFTKKGDRAQFLKAFVAGDSVSILDGQSSAMLQTFAFANGLVFLPEETIQIESGDLLDVILI